MAEPPSSEYELATPESEPAPKRDAPKRPTPPRRDQDARRDSEPKRQSPPRATSKQPPSAAELPEEDDETPRPKPPQPPKPLPRISRSAPLTVEEARRLEDAEEDARRPGRKRRRRRTEPTEPAEGAEEEESTRETKANKTRLRDPMANVEEDGPRLTEPTPLLDTIETRHLVRAVLGLLAAGSVVLAVVMIVRAIDGGDDRPGPEAYVINAEQTMPPLLTQQANRSSRPDEDKDKANPTTRSNDRPGFDPNTSQEPEPQPGGFAAATDRRPFENRSNAPSNANTYAAPQPEPESLDRVQPAQPEPKVLPNGFAAAAGASEDPSGWPTRIVCEADGSTMALVPGGTYLIGRDSGSPPERPAHWVELPPFYIDVHEVTVGQYERFRRVMTDRGEAVYPQPEALEDLNLTDDHPIVLVSAADADRYAAWAGKRLPTESQWEAAARGPRGLIHPWGNQAPDWLGSRSHRQLDPVGAYQADTSPFGVADVAANAWEWTADWFAIDAYADRAGRQLFNPGGPPQPPSSPPKRAVRGSSPENLLSDREGMPPRTRLPYLGFRCVLNVEGAPEPVLPPPTPEREPTPPPVHSPRERPRNVRQIVPF